MADEENIELDNILPPEDTEGAEGAEQAETSFDDNLLEPSRLNPNRSIQIIDTSVPNVRRDVGVMKRAYTQDKKDFLREHLGIRLNKGDGPNSTILFDSIELTSNADRTKVNGMKYKGKKIIVYKNGQLDYSSSKSNEILVAEFKGLVEKAQAEHEKTATSAVEIELQPVLDNADDVDAIVDDVLRGSIESLQDYIDEQHAQVVERGKALEIPDNVLREVKTVLTFGVAYEQETGRLDETRPDILEAMEINRQHWLKMSEDVVDENEKKFFKNVADIEELQMDILRLRGDLRPETDKAKEILKHEAQTNDLTRLERVKQWIKRNFGSIAGVGVGLAGIIASVVVATRGFVRGAARGVKSFAKGVAKVAEKVGPLVNALLGLVANTLGLAAKGLTFLSNNLWLLVVLLVGYLLKKYLNKNGKQTRTWLPTHWKNNAQRRA